MGLQSKAQTTIPSFIGTLFLLHLLVGPASGQNPDNFETPDMETRRQTLQMNESHSYELHANEELVMVSVYAENSKTRLDR